MVTAGWQCEMKIRGRDAAVAQHQHLHHEIRIDKRRLKTGSYGRQWCTHQDGRSRPVVPQGEHSLVALEEGQAGVQQLALELGHLLLGRLAGSRRRVHRLERVVLHVALHVRNVR